MMTGRLQISNDGVLALSSFQQLACLTLEGCIGVGDAGVSAIAALQHLTDLDFGACDEITDSVRICQGWDAVPLDQDLPAATTASGSVLFRKTSLLADPLQMHCMPNPELTFCRHWKHWRASPAWRC